MFPIYEGRLERRGVLIDGRQKRRTLATPLGYFPSYRRLDTVVFPGSSEYAL
jgi:hypothetical protein